MTFEDLKSRSHALLLDRAKSYCKQKRFWGSAPELKNLFEEACWHHGELFDTPSEEHQKMIDDLLEQAELEVEIEAQERAKKKALMRKQDELRTASAV